LRLLEISFKWPDSLVGIDLPSSFAQSTYDAIVNNIYTSQKGNYIQEYIDDGM